MANEKAKNLLRLENGTKATLERWTDGGKETTSDGIEEITDIFVEAKHEDGATYG